MLLQGKRSKSNIETDQTRMAGLKMVMNTFNVLTHASIITVNVHYIASAYVFVCM